MKKYWKIILILGIILFGMCVYLLSKGSYSSVVINEGYDLNTIDERIIIECDNASIVTKNRMVGCVIKAIDFDIYVSSFSADLTLEEGLLLNTISFDNSNWQGAVANGDIDLYTNINKNEDFVIAEFTIKSDGIKLGIDSQISLDNIVISDNKFDEYKINSVNTNIRIALDDADLNSLTVDNIDFEFSKDIIEYNFNTVASEVTINASSVSSLATVDGTGLKNIDVGVNTFEIIVTAEDGNTKTYTIIIIKNDLFVDFTEDVIRNDNKKQLSFLSKNLTVSQMLEKIDAEAIFTIVDVDGNEKTADEIIGTGCKLRVYSLDKLMDQYVLVITGDVTGDGKSSLEDVKSIAKHYLSVQKFEKEEYISAVDFNKDNKISINDIIKLSKYISDNS